MKAYKFTFLIFAFLCTLFASCAPMANPAPQAATATAPAPKVLAEWHMTLPEDITFGFDSVWIAAHRDPNNAIRIDPTSNKVIAAIQDTGRFAHSVLIVGDSVWVDGEGDDMAKIDPRTNTIVARVSGSHTALAYGFDSIWSPTRKDALDRIDPSNAKVIASIPLGDGYVDNNNFVISTNSAIWVDHADEKELIKIDPDTNRIVTRTPYDKLIDQAKAQTSLPVGKATDFMWWSVIDPDNPRGCGLLQIDPNTGSGLSYLPVGGDCNIPTVTDRAVWLSGNSQIERFNPATGQIDKTYTLQPGIWRLGIGFGSIWVLYEPIGLVQRLDIKP